MALFLLISLALILFLCLGMDPVTKPVKNWWGGTPLKTCTLPPLWALSIGFNKKGNTMMERHPAPGPVLGLGNFLYKIFDRRSGNRPTLNNSLPYQAGALSSPPGLCA